MRRSLAVLVALSVFALQVQALAFHVHSVPAHDEEHEHHHGPAIHQHHQRASGQLPRLSESDSIGRVITITVPSATPFSIDLADAEVGEVLSLYLPEMSARVSAIDVRSHGPPQVQNSFLRGPPSSNPI